MSRFVVFDVDDVLCPTSEPLQKALTQVTGKDIPVSEWFDFNLMRVYGVSYEVVHEAFHVGKLLETPMHEFTATLFDAVRASGLKVGVLTARSWHPDAHAQTLARLQEMNAVPDRLTVCDHGKSKAEYIRDFGEVVGYVDDNASHVHDVSLALPKTLCFLRNKPWNASYQISEAQPNVQRVDCPTELLKFL